MVNPTLLYAHPVCKGVLKEYGLLHTVAEWYASCQHESALEEYGLFHTVAEWCVCRKHKVLPIKTECSTHGNMCCNV